MKGDDIADRLLRWAAEVMRLVGELPKGFAPVHAGRQLVRAATSAGANCEEARSAESPGDFAHKVLLGAKELRESVYWLKLLQVTGLSRGQRFAPLIEEGTQLLAILTASAKTAKRRLAAT